MSGMRACDGPGAGTPFPVALQTPSFDKGHRV